VVVWDAQAERASRVERVVTECGGAPVRLTALGDALLAARCADCSTALIGTCALGGCEPSELTTIRTLKGAGFEVIVCFEQGIARQPLGVQCRAFLAGCSDLLDSDQANFESLLRAALQPRLRERAERDAEERRLRTTMQELGIVGDSVAMLDVFRLVLRVAPLSGFPVLITGESGTGKELLARAIHRLDPVRRNGAFLPVNCAAIGREVAESELFGHRRGAFTGADRDRRGLFRAADGGVLFLDEIAELDEALQAKLLRVLQEQRVLGLGEEIETAVNVRVIAATNADLQERIRQRLFRADLFNRLNALAVHIPPLRERASDIRLLTAHFFSRLQFLRGGGSPAVGEEFVQALARLELPGNARQLENLIRWVLVNQVDDHVLTLRDLPSGVWEQLSLAGPAAVPAQETSASGTPHTLNGAATAARRAADASLLQVLQSNHWNMSRSIAHCERLMLQAALEREVGNQSRTARLLGITARSVYNKLRKHGLNP